MKTHRDAPNEMRMIEMKSNLVKTSPKHLVAKIVLKTKVSEEVELKVI